jgi:hypothetical protein
MAVTLRFNRKHTDILCSLAAKKATIIYPKGQISHDKKPERCHVIKPFFIRGMCMVVLVMELLVSGCTTGYPGGKPDATTMATVMSPSGNPDGTDCRLMPCHGLDLMCGPVVPEICTKVYQLGDKCRQFAQCTVNSDGNCQIVTMPEFDSCISCVKMCMNESVKDPSKSFTCEEKC